MFRYLINLQYIGSQFRGTQIQNTKLKREKTDIFSVQGILELALRRLNSVNYPLVYLSSRTDKGVHALQSSVHVNLERKNGFPYHPDFITINLNKFFKRNDLDIRILNTQIVNNKFNARRSAKYREYLYRFAVLKVPCEDKATFKYYSPIEDNKRCYFTCSENFDFERVQNACKLFLGRHDFRSFMKNTKGELFEKSSIRTIDILKIEKAQPKLIINNFQNLDHLEYYDITCRAPSFLYNQVRRIVTTLIAIGKGKITERDIKIMLEVPSKNSWSCINLIPPHGLYLLKIKYDSEDLKQPEGIEKYFEEIETKN